MSWKNSLIKTIILLFKKRRGTTPSPTHFLIVSTTGLGDTLWATPALRALRERNPEATIDVLTTPLGKDLLKNNPHLNEVLTLSDSLLSFVRPFFKLRKKGIGTAYLFHTSQRMTLPLVALCGIPNIVGIQGQNKGLDSLLTTKLPPMREHEISKRMRLIGCTGEPQMQLFWNEEFSLKGGIALHPGAKDRFKQYPKEKWIEVGRALQKEFGCALIVTGNAGEKKLCDEIASHIPEAQSLAGSLSISALAALISHLDLFITNDTGPMHVALAVGTKTLALFAPTDSALCGPYHASHGHVIQKPPTCFPCLKKRCVQPFCLLQIPPSAIIERAKELLK